MSESMVHNVFLGIAGRDYPSDDESFSPSEHYLEYPFEDSPSVSRNDIYRVIREGLHIMGYDSPNFGKAAWNPLGDLVKPNATVLLKPNWVLHYSKNAALSEDLTCQVTHPSVVRAILDYVVIALKGQGRIIIADAPMQSCKLDILLERAGYGALIDFYRARGVDLSFRDLRQIRVDVTRGLISGTVEVSPESDAVRVHLDTQSAHRMSQDLRYKVSDYGAYQSAEYHSGRAHSYSIHKEVLAADVIINLPKPKTHKLAGLTGAQKNLVGVVYDKASLPHRTIGSVSDGGDEYPKPSLLKRLLGRLEEVKLEAIARDRTTVARILHLPVVAMTLAARRFRRDPILLGSWYGNDTIWRTVADLNYIVTYADSAGGLQKSPQRRVLHVADMIVSGQGNGPIAAYPKPLGLLLIGEDAVSLDRVLARTIGFDEARIPGLRYAAKQEKAVNRGLILRSNNEAFDGVSLERFEPLSGWRFEPADGWKGHVEWRK